MAEISSDPHSHSRSTPLPSTSTVQAHASPTSFRQPIMPTTTPTSNSIPNASANPGDNTKSFMRWSTTSSLPSEPETGKSTWSFHPAEYDPDVPSVDLSNVDFGPSTSTEVGTGTGTEGGVGGAGDRSSFDTFGRGTPPRSRVERWGGFN